MTIKQISQLCDNEGLKPTVLEKKIGASKGVISRAINNNSDISSKWIGRIVENYPRYNPAWLLTGKGSMLLKEGEGKPTAAVYNEGEGIKDRLISQLEGENRRLIASEARLLAENTELKKENTSLRQENKELIEKKQSYEVKPKPKNTQGVTA